MCDILDSIYSFICPVCKQGHQRPSITSSLARDEWSYECDHCQAAGTRSQLQNSAIYAATIQPRKCPICGDHIRPHAQRMAGDWWMKPSHKWIWLCLGCAFIGTLGDFAHEAKLHEPMFNA